MDIANVKGTHDVILEEANSYQKIEDIMRAVTEGYGFSEFRPPVIENSPLFIRSVGESSDVVRKEMYDFLDKGGRSITLRPEFTAGIVRSFVNAKLYATKDLPIKAYYYGPVFRYERPQLGRYRQFEQFGVEVLGVDSLYRDVETMHLGFVILSCLGLENVTMKINSLGDETSRIAYKEALKAYFKPFLPNMCADCKSRYELNPLRILDCKDPNDIEIVKGAPKMSDYLSDDAKERFDKVCQALDGLGISYEIDSSLVRGLDYYSETVFEFHYVSKLGKNYGAIGAGGHYDKLIGEVGGPKDLTGVGFSFGIERIHSVLKDDELIKDELKELDVYVMPIGLESQEQALYIASMIRTLGYACDINLSNCKMARMFQIAERKNAKIALIIGENEIENGSVILKDMASKAQSEVRLDDLATVLDGLFTEEEDTCHHHDDDCCCHEEGEHECSCHHHDEEEHHCCCHDKKEGK